MAATVVDEAVRRQLCAGARIDRIATLDNFCWPDPVQSRGTPDGAYKLAQLVRACRGLYTTCRAYGSPLISGKDSMKNEAVLGGVKISVPPTLLLSAIGQIDDVRDALTLDFKQPGDVVYLLGATGDHTGGSEYYRYLGEITGSSAELGQASPFVGNREPTVDLDATLPLYEALHRAIRAGFVRSAATPAKGGLGVALARCVLAGRLGARLEIPAVGDTKDLPADTALFSESNGRFVVTTAADRAQEFESFFEDLPCHRIGAVTSTPELSIRFNGEEIISLPIEDISTSFKRGLADA
jgi:phosphoribosylformylglycinamidine synthase